MFHRSGATLNRRVHIKCIIHIIQYTGWSIKRKTLGIIISEKKECFFFNFTIPNDSCTFLISYSRILIFIISILCISCLGEPSSVDQHIAEDHSTQLIKLQIIILTEKPLVQTSIFIICQRTPKNIPIFNKDAKNDNNPGGHLKCKNIKNFYFQRR